MKRNVEFEIDLVFAAELAIKADRLGLGQALQVAGFLAPRRRQSKSLLLHVSGYELIESDSVSI